MQFSLILSSLAVGMVHLKDFFFPLDELPLPVVTCNCQQSFHFHSEIEVIMPHIVFPYPLPHFSTLKDGLQVLSLEI